MTSNVQRIERPAALPPRHRDAHKGAMGRVLVVAGSGGMIGAPALAAMAALRGGAGLVTMALPECIQLTGAALCPCATSAALPCGPDGVLTVEAAAEVMSLADASDVLAVGPGMGVGLAARMVVQAVLSQNKPVVLDADGLNNLAAIEDWPGQRKCPLILTPHPGEMARLISRTVGDIQADREAAAIAATRRWLDRLGSQTQMQKTPPLVLVLKGAGTVVTDGRRLYLNDTGNPGMASGGTGDVLTGVIAALMAQGLKPFDAAALGARVHGAAGDAAAERVGEVSLIATDVLEDLPKGFRRQR